MKFRIPRHISQHLNAVAQLIGNEDCCPSDIAKALRVPASALLEQFLSTARVNRVATARPVPVAREQS